MTSQAHVPAPTRSAPAERPAFPAAAPAAPRSVPSPVPSQPRPTPQAKGTVVALNAANFDATIHRPGAVVLVDFAADWCGPCRQLAPTIERIAAKFGGQVTVGRVDVDTDEAIALRYGVEALPTLIYFKNGQPQSTSVGPASEQAIAAQLQQMLR